MNRINQKFQSFRSNFSFKLFNYELISANIIRNNGRSLASIFLRLIPVQGGKVSRFASNIIYKFLYRISQIGKAQGMTGLVKYLKVCSVITQQVISGHRIKDLGSIGPRVSRTNSGLPRIIPMELRKYMLMGHHSWVRLVLTILSLFRDIFIPGKEKLKTITDTYSGTDKGLRDLNSFIPLFIKEFVPKSLQGRKSLLDRFKFFPITKSSPDTFSQEKVKGFHQSTTPLSLLRSINSLREDQIRDILTLYHIYIPVESEGPNKDRDDLKEIIGFLRDLDPDFVNNNLSPLGKKISTSGPGKLGLKFENAGKVRVFAMLDPWTQMVMAPLHKSLFSILRRRSNVDGTFDQLAPLKRALASNKPLFSMDLSAATDRLPISIQENLIKAVFSLTSIEAKAWSSLLVNRDYHLKRINGPSLKLRYGVGQPMGALSSWAMLAMTHHLIVRYAAFKVGLTNFCDYAVLGDDIVIYNSRVAKSYSKILASIGVECNLNKSILSPSGKGMEFAKRTFYLGKDVSPTPLKEFYSALMSPPALAEFGRKYKLTFVQLLKAAGFGYKVIGGLNKDTSKLNQKIRYLAVLQHMDNPVALFDHFFSYNKWVPITRFTTLLANFVLIQVENKIRDLRKDMKDIGRPLHFSQFKNFEVVGRSLYSDFVLKSVYSIFYHDYRTRLLFLHYHILPQLEELRDQLQMLYLTAPVQAEGYAQGLQSGPLHAPGMYTLENAPGHYTWPALRYSLIQIFDRFARFLALESELSSLTMSMLRFDPAVNFNKSPKLYQKYHLFLNTLLHPKVFIKGKMEDLNPNQQFRESGFLPSKLFSFIRFVKPSNRVLIKSLPIFKKIMVSKINPQYIGLASKIISNIFWLLSLIIKYCKWISLSWFFVGIAIWLSIFFGYQDYVSSLFALISVILSDNSEPFIPFWVIGSLSALTSWFLFCLKTIWDNIDEIVDQYDLLVNPGDPWSLHLTFWRNIFWKITKHYIFEFGYTIDQISNERISFSMDILRSWKQVSEPIGSESYNCGIEFFWECICLFTPLFAQWIVDTPFSVNIHESVLGDFTHLVDDIGRIPNRVIRPNISDRLNDLL